MVNSNKLQIAVALMMMLVLIGGVFFFLQVRSKENVEPQGASQEFKELKVVQFYFHMPGKDYIIGRAQKSFPKVLNAAGKAVLSISEKRPLELKDVRSIESEALSVSVWLLEPQKISTKIKPKNGPNVDKYGNTVLLTDRFLIVMSGRYRGRIFVRDPATSNWQAWAIDGEGMSKLVELVRTGGL